MLKIFLSSHGKLASGMRSSLEILIGDVSNITTFDAYVEDGSIEEHVEKYLEENPEGLRVLCSDILNGSVNQVLARYSGHENVVVITGINLALLLSLALSPEDVTREDIETMVMESREMTKIIDLENEEIEEQGDFF